MFEAKNKIVAITGASSGLGWSLAIDAGCREAKVALLARRESLLKNLKNRITSNGGQAIALPTDVGNPNSVKKAFGEIESTWGRIDIFINCAGAVEPISPLIKTTDDDLLKSLMTNVFGVYLTTRESLRIMLKQEEGGTIINITSGAGSKPYVGWSAYCSQKAAVNMVTRCAAMEVFDKPIRVLALSPGPFESHMQELIREANIESFPSREKFLKLHKEGKLKNPETLARIILDIALTDWPEISGRVEDLRSADFQKECIQHGLKIVL